MASQPLLPLSLDSSLKPFFSNRCHSHHLSSISISLSLPLLSSPSSLISLSSPAPAPAPAPAPQAQSRTFHYPLSLSNLQTLTDFSRSHTLPHGHGTLLIRPVQETEIDAVSRLLAESFIETLFLPPNYAQLLAFLVKNYLIDRRALLPHAALLVGFYSHFENAQEEELVCTAEISFNQRGANAASPTPVPPPDCPYICNMTVKNSLRRKGIGKQLLKTCEDLICKMTEVRDVYLHCRMVDKVPLSMYKNAGYQIVKTDSFLVWLTLQKRKYLLRKTLIDPVDSEPPRSEEL